MKTMQGVFAKVLWKSIELICIQEEHSRKAVSKCGEAR
jgi:hypothetical protein